MYLTAPPEPVEVLTRQVGGDAMCKDFSVRSEYL